EFHLAVRQQPELLPHLDGNRDLALRGHSHEYYSYRYYSTTSLLVRARRCERCKAGRTSVPARRADARPEMLSLRRIWEAEMSRPAISSPSPRPGSGIP